MLEEASWEKKFKCLCQRKLSLGLRCIQSYSLKMDINMKYSLTIPVFLNNKQTTSIELQKFLA